MLDVTSSISIARFEPWTEREGGGQMRSGKRVAKRALLQRRYGREGRHDNSSLVQLESHRCARGTYRGGVPTVRLTA